MQDTILVTGGAGFIGSNFVLRALGKFGTRIVNLDLLTYAGNAENLASLEGNDGHALVRLRRLFCAPTCMGLLCCSTRPSATGRS
jgi:dTDP-D-glucose 4,6-dehydratase